MSVRDLICLGRQLWECAEPGFHAWKTHRLLARRFENLGFTLEEFPGIPGFAAAAKRPTARGPAATAAAAA